MNEVPLTPPGPPSDVPLTPPPPPPPWGAQPPPKKGMSTGRKWLLGTVVVVAVLAVIGAAGGDDSNKSSTPDTSTISDSFDTPATETPVTDTPVTASSGSTDIAEWSASAGDTVERSGQVLTDIADLATNGDISGTISACEDGQSVFAEWPPLIADAPPTVREPMAAAYAHMTTALASCAAGDLVTATSEMSTGAGYLQDATAAVEALTP